MKEPTQQCMNHLESLRRNWLALNKDAIIENGYDVVSESKIHIEGLEYTEHVYSEKNFEERVLIIFELSRPRLIGSTHHCLGIEIGKDHSKKLLSQEDLWDEGIP